MSINYNFEIETKLCVQETLTRLFTSLNLNPTFHPVSEGSPVIYGSGPNFTIYGHSIENSSEALTEALNLIPTIRANFRRRKSLRGDEGEVDMLTATFDWLKSFPDNCALLFNGELVLFVRKDGQLSINSNTDFWNPEFRGMINLPYREEPFSIL